jgi:hypothetical protein
MASMNREPTLAAGSSWRSSSVWRCQMFAEAAGWSRPIRFTRGSGGHAADLQVAQEAREHGVRRLLFRSPSYSYPAGVCVFRATDSGALFRATP